MSEWTKVTEHIIRNADGYAFKLIVSDIGYIELLYAQEGDHSMVFDEWKSLTHIHGEALKYMAEIFMELYNEKKD